MSGIATRLALDFAVLYWVRELDSPLVLLQLFLFLLPAQPHLLADLFGGRDLTGIALQGIDHVISLSLVGERVLWRTYAINFKASDSKVPRVELIDMGPSLDMTVRRQHVPSLDLDKVAHKAPAAV